MCIKRFARVLLTVLLTSRGSLLAEPESQNHNNETDIQEIDASKYIDSSLADCGIQKAIDAAALTPDQKTRVVLPDGVYPLRCSLSLGSNTILSGHDRSKTILTLANPVKQVKILNLQKTGWLKLASLPQEMKVGTALEVVAGVYRKANYRLPAFVTDIKRQEKMIRIKAPYGVPRDFAAVNYGHIFGLEREVKKNDTFIVLKDATSLREGDELFIGKPDSAKQERMIRITKVVNNKVFTDHPITMDIPVLAKKIPDASSTMVFRYFPMIRAQNIDDSEIKSLTIVGFPLRPLPVELNFIFSGIHLSQCHSFKISGVTVKDWPADGFSVQGGNNILLDDCRAVNIMQNGYHPGTGLRDSSFVHCSTRNCRIGVYWCYQNQNVLMKKCDISYNRGSGITGLGHPGDQKITIEDCIISNNGLYGILINGGKKSHTVIRNNIIENNSNRHPGRFPGIAIHAIHEDAEYYTVEDNLFKDKRAKPTQWIGIEEENGVSDNKPTKADHNLIQNNTFVGMRTADVIYVGPNTKVKEKQSANIIRK